MPEIWFPNLGIEIAHLDRVAFTVFGRNVYWYGIFIGLAVVLGVLMAMKEAKRTGQSPDMYVDFIIYALIFAIIGARLYYVIFSWDFYSAHPEKIFALREGGLAHLWRHHRRRGDGNRLLQKERGQFLAAGGYDCTLPCVWADAGTLGEFLQPRSVWRLYEVLLAMRLQMSQVRTSDISAEVMQHIVNYGGVDYIQVHPTFLYESLWNLCLFLLLIKFRPKKKFDGQVLGLYFLGYALGRVWIEGLRTDQLMFGPFAVSQLLSGGLIICAAIFLIRKGKQEKAKKESES